MEQLQERFEESLDNVNFLPEGRLGSATPSKSQVSTGLGVFSLALGLSEALLTRGLSRQAGLDPAYSPLLRIFGLREITSGLGLLSGRNEQAWLWSRVIGDALDVSFLGFAFLREKDSEKRKRIAIAAAAVSPVVALDIANVLRGKEAHPGEIRTHEAA